MTRRSQFRREVCDFKDPLCCNPYRPKPKAPDTRPVKRVKFAPEEDAKLIQLRGNGMEWEVISGHLEGRSAVSCRRRFTEHLQPRLGPSNIPALTLEQQSQPTLSLSEYQASIGHPPQAFDLNRPPSYTPPSYAADLGASRPLPPPPIDRRQQYQPDSAASEQLRPSELELPPIRTTPGQTQAQQLPFVAQLAGHEQQLPRRR